MGRPFFWRFVAPVLLLVTAIGLPTVADAQSVLDRIKKAAEDAARAVEAKKKAADEAAVKEREKQKPSAPTAPGASGTGAAPTAAAPSFDGPAQRGNYGKIADYKAMPDIMGVRLGMPLAEALAAMRREFPTARIDPEPFSFNGLPSPPQEAWKATPTPTGRYAVLLANGRPCEPPREGQDTMEVVFTAPPNPQLVARIDRCYRAAQASPLHKKVVLQSLREKYGKETIAYSNRAPGPVREDGLITELYWLFDETGRPAPLPAGLSDPSTLEKCIGHGQTFIPRDVENYDEYFAPGNSTRALTPWCASSGVGLRVMLGMLDNDLIGNFRMYMTDVPLMLRELKNTRDWWRAEVERLRKEEIERSKQQKPRL